MRWYRAVAVDLDGTLTTGGWPVASVFEAIRATRAHGVRLLLVTGRILSELDVEFPGLAAHFDVVVAENGCVLRQNGLARPLADPLAPQLLDRLHAAGVAARRGLVLLATDASADHLALDAIESLGLDVHLVRNRGALMLMPPGVTKGTGLREALAELGISPHNTLAVGDAENDQALLGAAELGVAVHNAVPSLRDFADLVLTGSDGAGVAALLSGPVLDGRQRVHSRRWQILLGRDAGDRAATVPASQTNLLITGESESGKSYLAGLVIEQLHALGYGVLVVDPEGDHVALAALRGVTVLSGGLPFDPAQLPALLSHPGDCVVIDLSHQDSEARDAYLDRLWPALAAFQSETGLPHWVVVEEAQNLTCCRSGTRGLSAISPWNLCLVSYLPEQLAAELVDRNEWQVGLAGGGRTAILTPPEGEPFAFKVGARALRHVRHWHKYVDSELPEHLRFVFRAEDPDECVVASNMRELMAALHLVPASTISFHAHRGDFSRWIADA